MTLHLFNQSLNDEGAGMGNRETFKELVEELETKVEEARNKGVEDDTADRRAKDARKGKKKKKGGDSGDEESGDDDEGNVKIYADIQCVSKKNFIRNFRELERIILKYFSLFLST